MRLATEEEVLAKEVALALSQEMLDDVDSGRSARLIDVTSDGTPPAESVIARMVESSQDLPEEPEAAVPPDAPSGSDALPSGHSADGGGVDPPGTVAALPDATLTPSVRPREELPAAAAVEPPRSRPRLPSTSETTSEPEREVILEETMRHLRQLERTERQETRAAASAAAAAARAAAKSGARAPTGPLPWPAPPPRERDRSRSPGPSGRDNLLTFLGTRPTLLYSSVINVSDGCDSPHEAFDRVAEGIPAVFLTSDAAKTSRTKKARRLETFSCDNESFSKDDAALTYSHDDHKFYVVHLPEAEEMARA